MLVSRLCHYTLAEFGGQVCQKARLGYKGPKYGPNTPASGLWPPKYATIHKANREKFRFWQACAKEEVYANLYGKPKKYEVDMPPDGLCYHPSCLQPGFTVVVGVCELGLGLVFIHNPQ